MGHDMNRSRRRNGVVHLQEVELVPITDPAQQAALDRTFKTGKVTKKDRRLLDEARQASENGRRKS
jgi:hypothetical protein